MYVSRKGSILRVNDQEPAAQERWRSDRSGDRTLQLEGTQMNRMWFEIVRFYLLVALRGDPKERRPETRPVARAKPASITGLKPLTDTK
jgi:hypothetical protein